MVCGNRIKHTDKKTSFSVATPLVTTDTY